MAKFWTNATKEEVEEACRRAGGKVDPLLEIEKKGQLTSCRIPLQSGKEVHIRYLKGGIMEYETEEPISKPIKHITEPQIPIKEDFEKTMGIQLRNMGKEVRELE